MNRLILCLGIILLPSVLGAASPRPIVGAIRWDAWHGDQGVSGKAVQQSLGPKAWHYRVPFFGEIISDSAVKIPGYSQSIVDQEIAYAKRGGLDYWAFLLYDPQSPMSQAISLYLSSEHKRDVNFCAMIGFRKPGADLKGALQLQRVIRLMQEPSYQKVKGNRPLFYMAFFGDNQAARSMTGSRQVIDEFRAAAQRAGLDNPYIVVMGFVPIQDRAITEALGCDAVSAYATAGEPRKSPYAALAQHAEKFWDRCRDTGAKVVPIVMAGWDRRPRIEHPVPWEKYQKPGVGMDKYYVAATPKELATHLESALHWIEQNPAATDSQAVIIYAWNENDEGGWLLPTLSEGTARLDAFRKVLRPE